MIDLSMAATLERRDRFGFSGTALSAHRPAERLLPAGGGPAARAPRGEPLAVAPREHSRPVGARRLADRRAEGAAEGPQAGEADVEADLGDAAGRCRAAAPSPARSAAAAGSGAGSRRRRRGTGARSGRGRRGRRGPGRRRRAASRRSGRSCPGPAAGGGCGPRSPATSAAEGSAGGARLVDPFALRVQRFAGRGRPPGPLDAARDADFGGHPFARRRPRSRSGPRRSGRRAASAGRP